MKFWTALFLLACCALPARAQDLVARGRYLAILGDCAGCHTVPNQAPFSGGLPFTAAFGTLYSTNITPDPETGLGTWTKDDFYRALHDGVAKGGKHLYPAFPYIYFTRITRADTDALFAYLKTIKPVHRASTPNKLLFPFNIRAVMFFWDWLFLDRTPFKPDPHQPDAWNRGSYIVNGLGHCAACHTPKNIMFGDEAGKQFAGGTQENWFANNLTSSTPDGLGRWTEADIAHFLAQGRNRYATAAGSMLEKVNTSTSHMTDADRQAIAIYLKSLPPKSPVPFEAPRREQMARGEGLYRAHCQSCHGMDGKARAGNDYPQLAGDALVAGHDPTTVLRVILEGATAPAPQDGTRIKPMPAFRGLDDGEIADMASYIRNAWGNRAPTVSATDVHILRQALKT